MPLQITNGIGKVGIRTSAAVVSIDSDAQAFITAAALTDTTQKNAIDELVKDLKAANIWTKMKAIYPMIGGTATTHKFNLKDPRDTTFAFRLTFNGGWIHTSNGAQPNGTDGFANTFLTPTTSLSLNSTHISYYSKHNAQNSSILMGCSEGNSPATQTEIQPWTLNSNSAQSRISDGSSFEATATVTNSFGFYIANRTNSSQVQLYKGTSLLATFSKTSSRLTPWSIYLGARNASGSAGSFTNRGCAFASIGDGLTDSEAALFNRIVEKYQVTLGRSVNTSQSFYFNNSYSIETNNFLWSTQITNTTQQSAINTLVSTLKTAGIWTKMKAVYPMVGGTATTHKFNLVNPVDTNAAFRLTFSGGWVHSSSGATPNGSNAYADTNLIPNSVLTLYNNHISFYSRTNTNVGGGNDIGGQWQQVSPQLSGLLYQFNGRNSDGNAVGAISTNDSYRVIYTQTQPASFVVTSRVANNSLKSYTNGVLKGTNTTVSSSIYNVLPRNNAYISAFNYFDGVSTSILSYSNKQCAFASIGDGLTDAEATTFYNAVQAFQTTLGRQV